MYRSTVFSGIRILDSDIGIHSEVELTCFVNPTDSMYRSTVFSRIRILDSDIGIHAEVELTCFVDPTDRTPVATVTAKDGDEGSPRPIKIVNKVLINNPIDREVLQARYQFDIQVVATDKNNASRTSVTVVTINILDANDNYPEFSQAGYFFSAREDLAVGQPIGSVTATDKESLNNITYRIVAGNTPPPAAFILGLNTGFYLSPELSTIMKLLTIKDCVGIGAIVDTVTATDPDSTSSLVYSILRSSIVARDSNGAVINSVFPFDYRLTITVRDVNDNTPVFNGNYSFFTVESYEVGRVIGMVTATDGDRGLFGEILYTLEAMDELDAVLKFPTQDDVIHLQAEDRDSDLYNKIRFTVTSTIFPSLGRMLPIDGAFSVNPETGMIRVGMPAYIAFTDGHFLLNVKAEDQLDSTKMNSTQIKIFVANEASQIRLVGQTNDLSDPSATATNLLNYRQYMDTRKQCASISCISLKCLQKCLKNIKIQKSMQSGIFTACGMSYPILGKVDVELNIDDLIIYQELTVLENLTFNIILGIDFLKANKAHINFENNTLAIQENLLNVPLNNIETINEHYAHVKTIAVEVIPPHCEIIIPVRLSVRHRQNSKVILEPNFSNDIKNLVGSKW
ncbi:unnamed protein product [Mytilus edulis]|uniref:Cadherin domain-containing protein n=1 Tax=Mytilus edulis TaxID=6550 RepID=A0A8S3SC23_MYTED|nr:unnamed protein product [Mytilus edulis]